MLSAATHHGLADRIDLTAFSAAQISPFAKHVLIYYVTGNPGFIEYYRNLLEALAQRLVSSASQEEQHTKHKTQYHIHGTSLSGFELAPERPAKILSLNEIKRDLIERIHVKAQDVARDNGIETGDVEVVLIGHSIGTWLILETVAASLKEPSADIRISSGILLFPTVFDLAKSPNGLRFGWALSSPHSAIVISLMAQLLFSLVPFSVLTLALQLLLSMPKHHAAVTASMLKSRHLVEQALYMAHCELQQVMKDVWSDDLWGIVDAEAKLIARKSLTAPEDPAKAPSLYFYWGNDDHWVANATRDAIIAQRARTIAVGDELKPVMEVDKHGLPHAFTLVEGGADIIAGKIVQWLQGLNSGH